MNINKPEYLDELIFCANDARKNSYSPYSKYKVGAALYLDTHKYFYYGTNVENASYGLAMCAERSAIFHAVSLGLKGKDFTAMVVATNDGGTSCGACRQVLYEFNPDMVIYFCKVNDKNQVLETKIYKVSDLLIDPFRL